MFAIVIVALVVLLVLVALCQDSSLLRSRSSPDSGPAESEGLPAPLRRPPGPRYPL